MSDRTVRLLPLLGMVAIVLSSCQSPLGSDRPIAAASPSPSPIVQPSPSPQGRTYQVVAGSVYDGDTLRVTDGSTQIKIRLCGIDAPEKNQQLGIASRDHLRSLINQGDGSVQVIEVEQDRYGRTVAELFVKSRLAGEAIAVNQQMVADGYAYHYARYSSGCPNGSVLPAAEAKAEKQRLGVWKNPNVVKLWDYYPVSKTSLTLNGKTLHPTGELVESIPLTQSKFDATWHGTECNVCGNLCSCQ